ncbi:MAG: DUF3040 domain-containing protein [Acidobacteria bacterium]|nr:DUF3040 domain-containing protein [Acidobacteriota bacterium]MCH8984982.1 DUF3040 domain-containing protein [Acidobacteriota bacterium]
MPLNDHEREVLAEIERQFYEQDPELAHAVATSTPRPERPWQVRVAAVGLILGLGVMVIGFSQSTAVGLLGFLVMVASGGFLAERFTKRFRQLDSRLATRVESVKQRMRRER